MCRLHECLLFAIDVIVKSCIATCDCQIMSHYILEVLLACTPDCKPCKLSITPRSKLSGCRRNQKGVVACITPASLAGQWALLQLHLYYSKIMTKVPSAWSSPGVAKPPPTLLNLVVCMPCYARPRQARILGNPEKDSCVGTIAANGSQQRRCL